MDGSSFSGLFTLVEISHIVMGSDGKGTSRSRGSESQRSKEIGGTITGHPIMYRPHEVVGGAGADGEGPHPLVRAGPLPVFPGTRQRKWFAALLPNGIGAFWLDPLDRFPLKEAINRDGHLRRLQASRKVGSDAMVSALALIGFLSRSEFGTPMRDQTPPQPIKGPLSRLGMLPDNPLLLAQVPRCNEAEHEGARQGRQPSARVGLAGNSE
jgi:hypothetical protein